MTRVQCLCGADLKISEASSGVVMRVETHSCAGFNPLNPHAPAHESPGTVYELWSEAGNLVDTFATLQEARAASDPSDVGITAVADGQVVGSFELHATDARASHNRTENGTDHATGSRAAEPEWPSDKCSYCGADHDGIEIEWCDSGEHCDQCCPNYPFCEDDPDA